MSETVRILLGSSAIIALIMFLLFHRWNRTDEPKLACSDGCDGDCDCCQVQPLSPAERQSVLGADDNELQGSMYGQIDPQTGQKTELTRRQIRKL